MEVFFAAAGIQYDHTPLNSLLLRWWSLEHGNEVQKLLFKLLPVIIIWNLWKSRCTAKYGAKKSNTARVKFLILKDINHLLNTVLSILI